MGIAPLVASHLFDNNVKAETPKKGGIFRIGLKENFASYSLDPRDINSALAMNVNWQCRNNLVEISYKNEPIPELAESWESSQDALRWIFNLRKGVEFHNGATVEAKDVIFSINLHRESNSLSSAKFLLRDVESIKRTGKYTIIFNLTRGNVDLPYILSSPQLSIIPEGTADFDKCIGSGNYILERWKPGIGAITRKNPNSWKQGRGFFDSIETTEMSDINVRINALKFRQLDYINRCGLKTAKMIDRSSGLKVFNLPSDTHYSFPMQINRNPYNNIDVRLALKYVINRKQLVKSLLHGYGYQGNDHPIGINQPYFNSDLPQRQYDPDRAKFHLSKAGLSDHTFNLFAADNIGPINGLEAAYLYKINAEKAGIKINMINVPRDTYWSNIWKKKEWVLSYWDGQASPFHNFYSAYSSDSKWNETNWRNAIFDDLLNKSRVELNYEKRYQLFAQMQEIIWDKGGTVIPMFLNIVEAGKTNIRGAMASNMELNGMRVGERMWYGDTSPGYDPDCDCDTTVQCDKDSDGKSNCDCDNDC